MKTSTKLDHLSHNLLWHVCVGVLLLCATHSVAQAQVCSDGLDNDGDQTVDSLQTAAPGNTQSYSFADAWAVRSFVNTFPQYTDVPEAYPNPGALRADTVTADKVCRLRGYARHSSYTTRSWASCYNNSVAYWSDSQNNFVVVGGCTHNSWINQLNCTERVPDCRDGVDNDGDGRIDLADTGCASSNDVSETPHDTDCTASGGTSEGPLAQCNNGRDDDGDGRVDALTTLDYNTNTERYSFTSFEQIRDYINSLGLYTPIPSTFANAGALRNDDATALKACKLRGFARVVSKTAGNFSSCGDNNIAYWNSTRNDFVILNACTAGNNFIKTLVCEGRLPACANGIDDDHDGLVDVADGGCANQFDTSEVSHDPACSSPNDTTEAEACADGRDNDGDGVSDRNDPGCFSNPMDPATYSPIDDNEGDATTQCQDGIDNDNDGLSDRNDPGCWADFTDPSTYNRTRNNESAATTQCQDGGDNDGDGVVDRNDPGCWATAGNPASYDRTRNNEAAATTQCQDGADNDSDFLIDAADPGCWANPANSATYDRTRNNEAGGTTQCQDGADNDQDGLTDAADPGCWTNPSNPGSYDRNRNNEAAATTQCQDGLDNDGDGVRDAADPGCWTVPSNPATYDRTKNTESDATTQCQDNLDNDADGVKDSADPGCWSNPGNPASYDPTRNNERAATTQCQDSRDNDGDGLTDADDPGCWSNPSNPASYDRTRNNEGSATTQCQDGQDNDRDGRADLSDPGCSSPRDNSEDSEAIGVPTGLQASDNDRNGILVNWIAVPGATSYDLYRSEEPTDFNPTQFVKIATVSSNSFYDTSAVPGRLYNFAARATNGITVSGFSNVDGGIRPSDVTGGDSDGDGVSDEQEGIDGTDPTDGGSFALHLQSPAFSKYNLYLSQLAYFELIADGTLPVEDIRVTAFSATGQAIREVSLSIAAQTQIDLDINVLVGAKDTYGLVKVDFRDDLPGATLKGRMTNYRRDPNKDTFSFAMSRELRNPTRGDTYAAGNSYDPQGQGFLVPNWAEIVNLEPGDRSFVYSLYNQRGALIQQVRFTLPPLGERDIQAGHEFGEGVYLASVQPLDGSTRYLAGVARYSANARGGNEAATYNYAFNLEARAGNGSTQFAPISNDVGSCYSQSNWYEVANVRSVPVLASVIFRDESGLEVGRSTVSLQPKEQFHFNASALIGKGRKGTVQLDASLSGSLVSESLVYYHDCQANRVQTAYAVQSRIPGQDVQTGSINSFLGMSNELVISSTTTQVTTANLSVRPFGSSSSLPMTPYSLGGKTSAALLVNGVGAAFDFPTNSYGTLKIQTPLPKQVVPHVLRKRIDPDGRGGMDFVIPTMVQ